MTLSGSRQQFLSADVVDGETLRYSRKGGCFVSRAQGAAVLVAALLLAAVAAALVYFLAPCRTAADVTVKADDLWSSDETSSSSSTNIRLPKNLVPTLYRIKLKPNLANYTFEGTVVITLKTKDEKVNTIILNSKDLDILNGTELTELANKSEQNMPVLKRTRRQVNESSTVVNTETTVVNTTLAPTTDKPNEINPTNATAVTTPDMNNETAAATESNNIVNTDKSTDEKENKSQTPVETQLNQITKRPTAIFTKKNIAIKSQNLDAQSETIQFVLGSSLKANTEYVLAINFTGKLDDSLSGFYRSSYKEGNTTRDLAVTQFEPTSARKAFPCFDEPQLKAKFEISIAREKNYQVLSNSIVSSEEPIDGTDAIWTHFEQTVPMSTYLVAYTVFDLHSVEAPYETSVINAAEKAPIKIWTRQSLLNRTEYAARISPKILIFYEEYFDIPYALKKMDLVAVPDFASGAMENWGLITFRETGLLVDPKDSSMRIKQGVALDVAHEIAHQWFGNLVTMKWWTDLWLNEGFATYVEHIGVDKVEPNWNILDQFHIDKVTLMRSDALDSTHPVSQPVEDTAEISQKFDEISYSKGAILIRMLNHTLTESVFKTGLQNYLKKWKFSNADKDDLWESLTEVASKHDILPANFSVAELMDSWTLQPGFPVVHITRNYENNTITLMQEIFTLPISKLKNSNSLWYVPISYATGVVPLENWSANATSWLMKEKTKEVTLALEAKDTWLYVNVFAIGYYRVNYDQENWKRLNTALHSGTANLPDIFKMQIVDDAFNLARVGLLNYTLPLSMSTYIADRNEAYIPWLALLTNFDYMDLVLETTSTYGYFQDYVLKLINRTMSDIGNDTRENDTQQTVFLRGELLMWACKMEDPTYIKWARDHFEAWTREANPDLDNPIPNNYRSIVYSTVLRTGGRHEFNFLWTRFISSNDPEVKATLIGSLHSTRNMDLLNRLYEYALTEMELQLAMYVWDSSSSKIAFQAVSQFVMQNWDRFYAKYNSTDPLMYSSLFSGMFSTITEQEELDKIKEFIHKHKRELKKASESLKKDIASAENRIDWKSKNLKDVENWLINFNSGKVDIDTAASIVPLSETAANTIKSAF